MTTTGVGSRLRHGWRGSIRYGPIFLIEVVVFWLLAEAVNFSGYGGTVRSIEPAWTFPVSFAIVAIAMGAGEARFHLYRRIWSVASLSDAFAVGLAVFEASLLITIVNLLFPDGERPFRFLAPILGAPAAVIGIGLLRLLPRLRSSGGPAGNRLVVVIPGTSGYATVKALLQHPGPEWSPVAIVTTGPADVGQTFMGLPTFGHAHSLLRWVRVTEAKGVAFVQTRDSDRTQERLLYAQCLKAQLPVFILPATDEWIPHAGGSRLRQLSADDLVGRDVRHIDMETAAGEIRDRTVLVTGAAGSIGSELCRMIARMGPRRMVLVDINESGLFDLGEELRSATSVDLREALVSIVDRELLVALFADERPDIVFHAAAYKHVPMLEAHPIQAVLTNVIGTSNTLRCASAAGVRRFILISTDKAVARHSVMGCTKRVCEQLVIAYGGPMTCWAVRFGNVVGSRGSVVPLFERQIDHGGPVTITHPDVSRYMMTISESASLVLSTLSLAGAGHLYMLDMGDPIKIVDLAEDLIRSRGLRPGTDIPIAFTGLRPGERLTEDLLAQDEGWRPTSHPAIREVVSQALPKEDDLSWTVERLNNLAHEGQTDVLVRVLKQAVQVVAEPEHEAAPPEGSRARSREPEPR